MSLTTGAEMVVMMSSTVAASRKNVPMWWKKPVAAIVDGFCCDQDADGGPKEAMCLWVSGVVVGGIVESKLSDTIMECNK